MTSREQSIIAQTRCWVKQVVIRHNLCPFAYKPFRNNTIRYHVSFAKSDEALMQDLIDELMLLRDADTNTVETTLVIVPEMFTNFGNYNQFLDVVEMLIDQFGLAGIIQVASFHPKYQFADLAEEDVRNYTNRSPYPMLHLILEESIELARTTHPNVEAIPETNMLLFEEHGLEEAQRQLAECLDTDGKLNSS